MYFYGRRKFKKFSHILASIRKTSNFLSYTWLNHHSIDFRLAPWTIMPEITWSKSLTWWFKLLDSEVVLLNLRNYFKYIYYIYIYTYTYTYNIIYIYIYIYIYTYTYNIIYIYNITSVQKNVSELHFTQLF